MERSRCSNQAEAPRPLNELIAWSMRALVPHGRFELRLSLHSRNAQVGTVVKAGAPAGGRAGSIQ